MPREGFWPPQYEIRLRIFASLAALSALLAISVTFVAFVVAFSWPTRDVGNPLTRFYAGKVSDFEVGQPVTFAAGRFHLVKQEDGSFVALHWQAPAYRGCSVPWRPQFSFGDPRTGRTTQGWFRDPCSGSTWDVNGVRVFGPASRNLDRFPVEVDGGKVYVQAVEWKLIQTTSESSVGEGETLP